MQQVVSETLRAVRESSLAGDERLAYLEPEAASLLGLQKHQLRDERLKGRVEATKVAGKWSYTRDSLLDYLARGRQELTT